MIETVGELITELQKYPEVADIRINNIHKSSQGKIDFVIEDEWYDYHFGRPMVFIIREESSL